MAWLYSHWRRSSSQSEGMTVQFCVSWFAGKAPAKKIARTAVTRRKAMQVSAKCTPLPYSITVSMRFAAIAPTRSEEHTSELQSLMRISYAVFCLKKKKNQQHHHPPT